MGQLTPVERIMRRTEYVQCRTFSHAWDMIPVTEPHPDGPSLWLRCTRCGTVRMDVCDGRYGSLYHRRYVYPDDYSYPGETMPSRDEFRLKLFSIADDLAARRAKRGNAHAS